MIARDVSVGVEQAMHWFGCGSNLRRYQAAHTPGMTVDCRTITSDSITAKVRLADFASHHLHSQTVVFQFLQ